MDAYLKRIYSEKTLMVVADLSKNYADSQWCQVESEAVAAFTMKLNAAADETQRLRMVWLRLGQGQVPGVERTEGFIDATKISSMECAELLLDRLKRLQAGISAIPIPIGPLAKPPVVADEVSTNLFLSEFDAFPKLRDILSRRSSAFLIAIFWMLLAAIPILLGYLAGANCMEAEITDKFQAKKVKVAFGYLAEPNHGWYYLLGVPILIFGTIELFNRASSAFRSLALQDRLSLLDNKSRVIGNTPLEARRAVLSAIAAKNRRIGIVAMIFAPLLGIGLIFGPEMFSLNKPWFGWVQIGNVLNLDRQSLSVLRGSPIDDVLKVWGKPEWDVNKDLRPTRWADLKADTNLHLTIRINSPENSAAAQSQISRWGSLFVVSGLLVQSAALSLILWFAAKSLVIIWVLLYARWSDISNKSSSVASHARFIRRLGRSARFQLSLDFQDPAHRFGLGRLDSVYYCILNIAFYMAVIFYMARLSNLAKGTTWPASHDPLLIGQLLFPVAVFLAASAVCLYPTWHLWNNVADLRDTKLEALPHESKQMKLIAEQSLWPGVNKGFVLFGWTVAFIVVLLPYVLEPGLYYLGLNPSFMVSVGRFLQQLCCGNF